MKYLKIIINRVVWIMIGIGFYTPFIFSINEIYSMYSGKGTIAGIIGWFFTICLMLSMVLMNRFIQKHEKNCRVFDEN